MRESFWKRPSDADCCSDIEASLLYRLAAEDRLNVLFCFRCNVLLSSGYEGTLPLIPIVYLALLWFRQFYELESMHLITGKRYALSVDALRCHPGSQPFVVQ